MKANPSLGLEGQIFSTIRKQQQQQQQQKQQQQQQQQNKVDKIEFSHLPWIVEMLASVRGSETSQGTMTATVFHTPALNNICSKIHFNNILHKRPQGNI